MRAHQLNHIGDDTRFVLAVGFGQWNSATALYATATQACDSDCLPVRNIDPFYALAQAKSGNVTGAYDGRNCGADPLSDDGLLCLHVSERSNLCDQSGDLEQGQVLFARAIAFAPSIPFAYVARARLEVTMNDRRAAMNDVGYALYLSSRYADASELRGELLLPADPSRAIEDFRSAAQSAPNWSLLHRQWAVALRRLHRDAEARNEDAIAARDALSPRDVATFLAVSDDDEQPVAKPEAPPASAAKFLQRR